MEDWVNGGGGGGGSQLRFNRILPTPPAVATACGGRFTVSAAHSPPRSGRPPPASPRFRVREAQLPRLSA